MDIQPIETTYQGVTFRSRLEARLAVMLDFMGIRWHYEYEGYQTSVGWYVPDYWLPDCYLRQQKGVLIEVKPESYFGDLHPALEQVANNLNVGAILLKGFELNEDNKLPMFQIAPWWDLDIIPYWCYSCSTALFSYAYGSRYSKCPSCDSTYVKFNNDLYRTAHYTAMKYSFW